METTHSETSFDLTGPARVLSALSTIGDLRLRPAVRVEPGCELSAAVELMEASGVSSLLVEGNGIVTERDIARALGHGVAPAAAVETIATWHPVVAAPFTTIVDAAAMMLNEHVRHLVVEAPAGTMVVSMRDVTAVLLQAASPHLWLTSLRIAIDAPAETWLG